MVIDAAAPPQAVPAWYPRLLRFNTVAFAVMYLANLYDREWLDAAQIASLLPVLALIAYRPAERSRAKDILSWVSLAVFAVLMVVERLAG